MQHADIIGERYQLDRKIGQGGTGSIWVAQDVRLERRVAIKFLWARNPEHQERLAKRVALEAKIAASIQHPNVVQIFDFGTHENNVPYIVMEMLSGFTLGEAFEQGHAFSLDTVIDVMAAVLRGLATVHHAGIVHRDLKPENVLLVKERGERFAPKLLDFGISRSLEPDTRRSAVTTVEGMIIGTPQYMSPEQARGIGDIDTRTDVYSTGVILFEVLTGFVPFRSENIGDLLIQVVREPPPRLFEIVPQVGKALCDVVDRALVKNREQRFPDAESMLSALLDSAMQIPSDFDRRLARFPPSTIKSRPHSKRAGVASEFTFSAHEVSQPPAAAPAPTPTRALEPAAPPALVHWRLRRGMLLGVSALAALVITVCLTILWVDRSDAGDDAGFIVVQAPPARADAAGSEGPPVLMAEPLELQMDDPRKKVASASKQRKQAKAEAADSLQLLATEIAQAFTRQKAKVISCFDEHPGDMESAPQLTLRVTVGERGQVSEALLLPESISSKPVAGCVTRAVRSMSFPAQREATTFRIPLHWRRK